MRHSILTLALALAVAGGSEIASGQIRPAAKAAPAPEASIVVPSARLPFETMSRLEGDFEDKVRGLQGVEPFRLMGASSSVYLDGYGVVFTVPLDLIFTPGITPMHLEITPKERQDVRTRKLAQLPALRLAARDMLRTAASSLSAAPENQKVAIAMRLFYFSWEDRTGLPSQVVISADRKSALTGDVKLEER